MIRTATRSRSRSTISSTDRGARARLRITQLVVRSATLLIAGGIVLGLAGAFALSRLLESRLFGVEAVDPLSYVAAATGLALVAFAASWLSARAATREDAAATLKSEQGAGTPMSRVDYDAELQMHNEVLRRAYGIGPDDHVLDPGAAHRSNTGTGMSRCAALAR